MITSVIFALTADEAEAGCKYQMAHPEEQIVVLAPELVAQNILLKNGLPAFEYFDNGYYHRHLYSESFRKSEQQVYDLTQKVLRLVVQSLPDTKDYLFPLQNWLEMAYLEVLETYEFYNNIRKRWQADKYFISLRYESQKTDLYFPFASQWELLRNFFIPRKKLFSLQLDYKHSHYNIGKPFHRVKKEYLRLGILPVIANRIKSHLFKISISHRASADILLFSGGRNLYTYEGLIKLLQQTKLRLQIITGSQSLNDEMRLRQKQIHFIPLSEFNSSEVTCTAEKETSMMLAKILPVVRVKCTQIFKLFPIAVKTALIKKTEFTVQENLCKIVQQTLLSKRVLEIYSPRLLITTHDPGPSAMPFVLSARKRQIPSLLLMHGWQDTLMGVSPQSDFIAVWSRYISRWYQRELGKKTGNIFSVGYPLFDELFRMKKVFWQKPYTIKPLPVNLKIGLLLTMYLPNTALLSKFINELFQQALKSKSDYFLSFRLHPSQPVAGIKELADFFGLAVVVNEDLTLDDFILDSDVVLSWDTTAMFQAMIYGKPLFYCTPDWDCGITPVRELGGAWPVSGADDLFKQFDNLIEFPVKIRELRKSQRTFLKKLVGVIDGSSSEKHVRLIKRLIQHIRLKSGTYI